ncbi:uncharacterized protein UV8b_02982 [Ustilaginoidea virens]|uniref:Secreted protein n=1 Tax=Ustilaginoidea virens TaxID=1159556 RepID=A0A063BZ60_USTVR|nr:uncharacterized protein UV8b_02982 [Ustilaginoidea virens]QUC18741.1 hypothetical protein UV8b_02982 [Ustilaginoidea virens]GAO15534.1 hypothetical protein UVI_02020560 [Ustilaginoidea virens]
MRFLTALAGFAAVAYAIGEVDIKVNADVEVASVAHVDVNAQVDIEAFRRQASGYRCPHSMSYCPWTKSCSCAPGQKLDPIAKVCVGAQLTGAWPEPDVSVYATANVKLGTFCAISPTRIVKYNPKHEYCQASLDTITFVALADIEVEVAALVEIDLNANISVELKNVCAALSGLYLKSLVDAVVLFNTNAFGLLTLVADVQANLSVGLLGLVNGLTCKLGLGNCKYDCVAYCTKGCKNYVEVVGEVGGHITGLVGLCILPKIILVIGVGQQIVEYVVESLLCLVGGLVKTVLSTFNCHCH